MANKADRHTMVVILMAVSLEVINRLLTFGAMGGFWSNYIGISAGSIAAYWLARYFGIKFVSKMISIQKYKTYIEWILFLLNSLIAS